MPRTRRRSRTRSRSHSYDRDREPKRRKIESFESPQHKRSLSSDKTHRSRQYDRQSSCGRRCKRSKRRSPASKKRHRYSHEKSLSRRKHSRRSYSTDQAKVPDIEFRHDTKTKSKAKEYSEAEENVLDIAERLYNHDDDNTEEDEDSCDEDDEEIRDLRSHIQRKFNKNHSICIPGAEQKSTHISALPTEILLYILRWVVSSDLDMRSLEMCSRTCRGFYLCCRDSEIWRLACARAWGLNLGGIPNGFNSWRQMFIERPRLQFNGCYCCTRRNFPINEEWPIFRDYPYLRFFPEGLVLMLKTADEPGQCVGHLKYQTLESPAILSGRYRLNFDKVTLVMNYDMPPITIPTFDIEMQIQSYKNQRHSELVLTSCSVDVQLEGGALCTLSYIHSLSHRFTRVRSYTAESYSPLQ